MSKKLNTKSFSDKDADIADAIENLYNVCSKYNSTMFARVVLGNGKYLGAYCLVNGPKAKKIKDCWFLLDTIAKFIRECSGGKIKMVKADD